MSNADDIQLGLITKISNYDVDMNIVIPVENQEYLKKMATALIESNFFGHFSCDNSNTGLSEEDVE